MLLLIFEHPGGVNEIALQWSLLWHYSMSLHNFVSGVIWRMHSFFIIIFKENSRRGILSFCVVVVQEFRGCYLFACNPYAARCKRIESWASVPGFVVRIDEYALELQMCFLKQATRTILEGCATLNYGNIRSISSCVPLWDLSMCLLVHDMENTKHPFSIYTVWKGQQIRFVQNTNSPRHSKMGLVVAVNGINGK